MFGQELESGSFSQPRIDRYFMTYHDNKRVAAIKSKRLRTAVEDLAGAPSEVLYGIGVASVVVGPRGEGGFQSARSNIGDSLLI